MLASLLLLSASVAMATEESAFADFKFQYNKEYASAAEHDAKFEVFKANLQRVDALNAKEKFQPYGVTKFMDMTPEEFKATYLSPVDMASLPDTGNGIRVNSTEIRSAVPTEFSWVKKGATTAVKNQGQCGSCWTFSGTETIESVCHLAGYELNVFAEQQIVDCDHLGGSAGCNGGLMQYVYEYVKQEGGIELEKDYPYTAQDGTCNVDKSKLNTDCVPQSWKWVSQGDSEDSMQGFLVDNSPLAIAVDAEPWQYYTGGVVTAASCGTSLDHGVQLVGYKQVNGKTVWVVRNSWGADWGEEGYVWLEYGKNTCGIAQQVTVPCINKKDGSGVQC